MSSWKWLGGILLVWLAARAAIADEQAKLTEVERQARTAEAKKLWEEAQRLDKEGKVKEAVELGERATEVERQLVGNAHADIALDLQWLALRYERREDFGKAAAARGEILQNRSQRLGEKHWQVTDARLALAHVELLARLTGEERARLSDLDKQLVSVVKLDNENKFAEAIPLAARILDQRKAILGERHRSVALAASWLGHEHQQAGHFGEAEPILRQAVEWNKAVLGEAHPEVASSLVNLAAVHESRGAYEQAESLYREAAEILKNTLGAADKNYAVCLEGLAAVYCSLGNYTSAERLYLEARDIKKRSLGEKHAGYATTLNNLGVLYVEKGDLQRAEPFYRQALEIKKQTIGDSDPRYATSLGNLASLYLHMADYARAEPLYLEALEIKRRALGESHADLASPLNNLGMLYQAMGNYKRAAPLLVHSLDIIDKTLGKNHSAYARGLQNFSLLAQNDKDYAFVEPRLREALEITKQTLGETHPETANATSNLGYLYAKMGDYARAEPLLLHATELWKEAVGPSHQYYARGLANLAILEERKGASEQAERLWKEALGISRQNLDLAAEVQSQRQQLGMLAGARDQLDCLVSLRLRAPGDCSETYDEVLAWKGQVLGRQRAMRAVAGRAELKLVMEELRKVAARLAKLSFATPTPAQAKDWKAQVGELSRQKEELEAKLAGASREYRTARSKPTTDAVQAALPVGSALIDFLEFEYSEPKAKDDGGGRNWERRLAAFVVVKEKGAPQAGTEGAKLHGATDPARPTVEIINLGPIAPIGELIAAWRQGLGNSAASRKAAQELRESVWRPIEGRLAGATTLLISPDGELGKIPLGALPGRKPGTYLIEEYTLAILPAPQAVLDFGNREAAENAVAAGQAGALQQANGEVETAATLLALGHVDYDHHAMAKEMTAETTGQQDLGNASRAPRDEAGGAFSPLPGTRAELALIQELFRQRFGGTGLAVLEAQEASKEALVREAGRRQYLHLATHGYFAAARFKSALNRSANDRPTMGVEPGSDQSLSGFNPGLLSGLALAGANLPSEEDDGILTAAEVEALDLSKVELVVLSACETGLGNATGGEGLLGLQRAFQASGARSVAASLWSVPDEATKMLMVRFYENLWKNKKENGEKYTKLEALREAQLWMLEHGLEQPGMRRDLEARGLKEVEEPGVGGREAGVGKRMPAYYWGAWVLSGEWR